MALVQGVGARGSSIGGLGLGLRWGNIVAWAGGHAAHREGRRCSRDVGGAAAGAGAGGTVHVLGLADVFAGGLLHLFGREGWSGKIETFNGLRIVVRWWWCTTLGCRYIVLLSWWRCHGRGRSGDTMVTVSRDTSGRLFGDAFEIGKSLSDGIELLGGRIHRIASTLTPRIWRGDVEDVISNVELEVCAWIDRLGAR